ncbi:hypothetical protein [Novipirellula caenicola]
MAIPELLQIRLMQDMHTQCIGRCAEGMQFFLNDFANATCQGLILYLFDVDGNYVRHKALFGDYPE